MDDTEDNFIGRCDMEKSTSETQSLKSVTETQLVETKRPKEKKILDQMSLKLITCPGINDIFLAFLMFLFMILASGFYKAKHAYCHVHPEENLPEWKLTCQFQEDLYKSKQSFQVYHINHEDSADLVVDGAWINDEPVIHTANGYRHVGIVSDKVVIRMKSHVVHHGGIYTCVLPPGILETVKTCQVPKPEELQSTSMMTTQLLAQVPSNGWRHVVHKETLTFTVTVIICGQLWSYLHLFSSLHGEKLSRRHI